MTPYISYGRKFEGMMRIAEKALDRECERLNPPMAPGTHESRMFWRKQNQKMGQKLWTNIQSELEIVFPECWNLQMEMVQAILRLCIRRIFMEELEMDIEHLVSECGLKMEDLANLGVILAPRRFGKTVSLAVSIAVLLICVPGFISVHFPIKLDEGPRLISDVLKYLKQSPRGVALLAASPKQRKFQIELYGPEPGDVRTCRILAASESVGHPPSLHRIFFCASVFLLVPLSLFFAHMHNGVPPPNLSLLLSRSLLPPSRGM